MFHIQFARLRYHSDYRRGICLRTSNLFYQSRKRRPEVARADRAYIWGKNSQRYIDGSSGAMVSNIGHSNPNVLAAMKAQIDSATATYRLHFENSAVEELARLIADRMPKGLIARLLLRWSLLATPDAARAMLALKGADKVGF